MERHQIRTEQFLIKVQRRMDILLQVGPLLAHQIQRRGLAVRKDLLRIHIIMQFGATGTARERELPARSQYLSTMDLPPRLKILAEQ